MLIILALLFTCVVCLHYYSKNFKYNIWDWILLVVAMTLGLNTWIALKQSILVLPSDLLLNFGIVFIPRFAYRVAKDRMFPEEQSNFTRIPHEISIDGEWIRHTKEPKTLSIAPHLRKTITNNKFRQLP